MQQRAEGILLCGMVGDALGAPVEGWPAKLIEKAIGKVERYFKGQHMGLNKSRYAMYTDDTNSTLALAVSLIRMNGEVNPKDCGKAYVEFWRHQPKRGYPGSAQQVLLALENGADPSTTGTMVFPDGSYANGGAMKIAPIGIVFHNVEDSVLREKVKLAILATHVHPEAIDGAFLIAKSISYLLHVSKAEDFNPSEYLEMLKSSCETDAMRKRISLLQSHYGKGTFGAIYLGLEGENNNVRMESYGQMDFQIRSVVAVGCSIWAFLNSWKEPLNCVVNAISLGGDTDTIASMTAHLVGALYGSDWIPDYLLTPLENGDFGRDYCIRISKELVKLM